MFWPFIALFKLNVLVISISQSLEQFFLTVGQNNFGNKIPRLTPWSRKSVWKTHSRMKNYPLLFPPFLTAWLWNTGEFVIYVYLLFPLNWTVWGCHSVALKLKVGFESWNMSLNYNCITVDFLFFSCLS